MDKITDHHGLALSRLAAQYVGKAQVEALVGLLGDRAQTVEDVIWAVLTYRSLDSAFGEQLDGIGQIVGLARNALDDPSYRVRLKAQIKINLSSGTGAEILDLFTLLTDLVLVVEEQFPAAFVLRTTGGALSSSLPAVLVYILQLVKAGGVKAILEWIETSEGATFYTDGNGGLGFGDSTDPTAGGGLAGALE